MLHGGGSTDESGVRDRKMAFDSLLGHEPCGDRFGCRSAFLPDGRRRALDQRNGHRKAIASPRNILHIFRTGFLVTQRLAKSAHVEAQATLIDRHISPDFRKEVSLIDHLAGSFDQHDEDVQSPPTDAKRNAILLQQPFRWKQPERSKRDSGLLP